MLFFQLPQLTLSLSHSLVLTASLLLLLDPRPFSVSFLICTSGKKYQSQAGSTNWPPPQPIPNPKININLPYSVHQHDLSNNTGPSPSHSLHCALPRKKNRNLTFNFSLFHSYVRWKRFTHIFFARHITFIAKQNGSFQDLICTFTTSSVYLSCHKL